MIRHRVIGSVLIAALGIVALSFVGAPVVHAASPTPGPGATPTAAAGSPNPIVRILPDPKQWASDVFTQVLIDLLNGIAAAIRAVVDSVVHSSLNFITQTPPAGSYASPTVTALASVVRTIANAALVLVALGGGFNLIVREHLGSSYHDALELFPRLVLGGLLVNTSLWWTRLLIDANNALCAALGQAGLPAWQSADRVTQTLVDVTAALIYLVTSLLLLLQMLMRLALVDVLLVVAPLALLCWVLPQTQSWARLWTQTFVGTVFTQFVQVLALKLGASLLTELTPMTADAALLTVLLGVAVLALTLKIPGLLRAHVGDGLGLARFVVYRQAARFVEGGPTSAGGG